MHCRITVPSFGIENFIKGVQKTNYFAAMGNSVIITVGSVAVIILCTSMCALVHYEST